MPIIIRAKKNESINDLIRKFKKITAACDVVQIAKDRRYYQKPSQEKAVKLTAERRLKRRIRSLKKRKNTSSQLLERLNERLNS